jgi:cell division protein ZapA
MSAEKSSVTVRIAGEEHTIRANTEPAYTKKCARLVDDRIHEIRSQSGLIEGHKAAILAALSIADEMFQARAEADRVRDGIASDASRLVQRIESEIKGS